jgi:D-alanine-D-alanine ligase
VERERVAVALLFGGQSAEHEVSLASAANVLRALRSDRYDVSLIGISRSGRWQLVDIDHAKPDAAALEIPVDAPQVMLIPAGGGRIALLDGAAAGTNAALKLDVVIPIMHGPTCEDGTLQGTLELANIAYVGSGVTASAIAMDKDIAKRLMRDAGLPIVPFISANTRSPIRYADAVEKLGTTDLFIKPANLGSSVGVSRAQSDTDFAAACELAFRYDCKILIERCMSGAREIECSVLEDVDGEIRVSQPGEIAPAGHHGFYSYEAKYIDPDGAGLQVPANLDADETPRFQDLAVRVFQTLGCEGMARVDFFYREGRELFVNEINTLPGFTSISMYPKLWEASGLSQPDLVDKLIAHALARCSRKVR